MKKLFSICIFMALCFSCSKKSSEAENSNPLNNNGFGNNTSAGVFDPPPTTPTVNGVSCNGTTADGDGKGTFPLANYNIKLSGQEAWHPQKNDTLLYPQKAETQAIFTSDGRLQVRVKVLAQPEPIVAMADGTQVGNCEGRTAGADNNYNSSQGQSHRYEKLSFDVNFYHSKLENNKWVKTTSVPFYSKNVQGVGVDKCSETVEVSSFQLASTNNPILAEISNVRTDMFCAVFGQYCPSERGARSQECYNVVMQVANDNTDGFK